MREAAQTLGAKPIDSLLTIDLPLLSRGIAVGATFAFTVSMGEFGASLFVAQRESVTIPVVIYRLLGDPGHGILSTGAGDERRADAGLRLRLRGHRAAADCGRGRILMLRIKGLSHAYGDIVSLRDVWLEVKDRARFFACSVPAAAARRRLLRIIAGLGDRIRRRHQLR